MRLSTIRTLLSAFVLALPMAVPAQIVTGSHGEWRYDGWERLKPKNAMVQYAGGMGMMSFGAGWEYGKRGMWNTDVLVGFLPRSCSDDFRFTFTLKQTCVPWSIDLGKGFAVEPFAAGLYVTTISGDEFWRKEPGKYPNHYYNFSSKMRFSVFLGQGVTFHPRSGGLRSVTAFYEVGTNELYIVSKVGNSAVRMKDILRFSFGVKMQICKPYSRDK